MPGFFDACHIMANLQLCMKCIAFTQKGFDVNNLYPFTLTRKVQDIRMGILTLREKWEKALGATSQDAIVTQTKRRNAIVEIEYISIQKSVLQFNIPFNLLPTRSLISSIKKLKPGQSIGTKDRIFVFCNDDKPPANQTNVPDLIVDDLQFIQYPWQIFELNKFSIEFDFELLTKGRRTIPIDATNTVGNIKNIFIEKGAIIKHCIINADEGPVYIGKNALVMEGSCIRGPVSIGENTVVKMGAKIYGATTIGPGCIVGGEIKNSVLFANSNKAHDGYLGDSVIGEWCNLGAGTSNSNLKNTAGNIIVHLQNQKIEAGIKCGVLMGDFSRTTINTSINTGTVIGVSCNVFGEGLTPKHIPSFSWGMNSEAKYRLDKALIDADNWKRLKNKTITEEEKTILINIYKH